VSDVGHGVLGVRSNLRPFAELVIQTASEKHVLVEVRPRRVVTSWSLYQTGTYASPLLLGYEGFTLDVVAVRSDLDTGLTRAESLADCAATAGTYYYDRTTIDSGRRWDDGIVWWDNSTGDVWDAYPQLYVHLAAGADPNAVTVVASFGFFFSGRAATHPTLGDTKLLNGTFESWSSASDADNWTEATGAGGSVAREAALIYSGTYSLDLKATASSVSIPAEEKQNVVVRSGRTYRMSALYMTPVGADVALVPNLLLGISGSSQYLQSNGRDFESGTNGIDLPQTAGEWRRVVVDFRAWSDSSAFEVHLRMRNTSGVGKTGDVYFDNAAFLPVWSFELYDDRLAAGSVPAASVGSHDAFFGGKQLGSGSLGLQNVDGLFYRPLADLDWIGSEVRVSFGGTFIDGEELLADDYRRQFTGIVQNVSADDLAVQLDVQDARAFLHRTAPPNSYDQFSFPGLDPSKASTPRALLLGVLTGVPVVRIDKDELTLYGTYEVGDASVGINGFKSLDAVYAYADEAAATIKDPARRIAVAVGAGLGYTDNFAATGRFTINKNPGPFIIQLGVNDRLDWQSDDGVIETDLTPGVYTAVGLAGHIRTAAQKPVGHPSLQCFYEDSFDNGATQRHTFRVFIDSGTTKKLLCGTGVNKERGIYKTLGFASSADLTGAGPFFSDTPVFSDPDAQHHLRVDVQGYKDDAAGSYTGSASALITKGADVCRFILGQLMRYPAALLDSASFVSARTTAPQALALYLAASVSTEDLFSLLEYSNLADILVDGTGVIFYNIYQAGSAGAVDLRDEDFQAYAARQTINDVFAAVLVTFATDPSTGKPFSRQATSTTVPLRFNRRGTKTIPTLLTSGEDAQRVANLFLSLSANPPALLPIRVRGKLINSKVGDKVILTRARALATTGALASAVKRIKSISQNFQAGESTVELLPDLDMRT